MMMMVVMMMIIITMLITTLLLPNVIAAAAVDSSSIGSTHFHFCNIGELGTIAIAACVCLSCILELIMSMLHALSFYLELLIYL